MAFDTMCCFRNSSEHGYRVLWEITNRCNQRCEFCNSQSREMTSYDNVVKCISKIRELNIKDIIITGGEPLMHPNIKEILNLLKQQGYHVDMCTNGSLLDDELISVIASTNTEISVSLDTSDKKKYQEIRKRDHFDKVIDNIKKLLKAGVDVHITSVVNCDTSNEVETMLSFIDGIGVKSISFIKMMSEIAAKDVKNKVLGEQESNEFLAKIEKLRSIYPNISINTKRFVNESNMGCMAGRNILGITTRCELVPCILLNRTYVQVIDLLSNKTSLQDLENMWKQCGNCFIY